MQEGQPNIAIFDLSKAISLKRLLRRLLKSLIVRKSHMSFRLVQKSVTLNDLQWCNDQTTANIWQFFRFFKMVAAAILDFQTFVNFNNRNAQELQPASPCQISSKLDICKTVQIALNLSQQWLRKIILQQNNNKNSSGDEIANVNFFYNIAHVEASDYAH